MPRNPNEPIPGFPEYTGKVRHEKKFHKTHFQIEDGVSLRDSGYNTGNKWVKRGRKWILVHIKESEQ